MNSTNLLKSIWQTRCAYSRVTSSKYHKPLQRLAYSTKDEPLIFHPSPENKAEYPEKLTVIVEKISTLTLIEVAELNELLKKTLNIPDTPMAFGAMPMAAAPVKDEEEEQQEATATKTSFTVKLLKFDADKKVPLIKELKNQIEGMNLVQAKKFVESAPQVVRADIGKDEADQIVAALLAVGGTCEIV